MPIELTSTEGLGAQAWGWARDLFPLCRSLTGEGVRGTLDYLGTLIPGLERHRLASGTQAFDWTIPKEWRVREAHVTDASGRRVIDFANHNLHLVGYSVPVRRTMPLAELDLHLHSLPGQPDAIPYVTSYYAPNWGFCLPHEQRQKLAKGHYEVVIDSEHFDGHLDFADWLLPGDSEEEILLSTYVCHPSMANNELSGPVVATALCRWLAAQASRRYSYRVVFVPETIGAIAYLSLHLAHLKARTRAGYVLSCVGDERRYSFLPSRRGDTEADRAGESALRSITHDYDRYRFLDRGSDERQYCSPHVDLPVASLMRSKYGTFPEYHTSQDDLDLVTAPGLQGAIDLYARALLLLEHNRHWRTTTPGEPQLGRRGLYPNLSKVGSAEGLAAMCNLLAYADGELDYLELCSRIEADPVALLPTVARLVDTKLLEDVSPSSDRPILDARGERSDRMRPASQGWLSNAPLALVALPLSNFLVGNLSELSAVQMLRVTSYAAASIALCLAIAWLISRRASRIDRSEARLGVALFLLVFFSYPQLGGVLFWIVALCLPALVVLLARRPSVGIGLRFVAIAMLAASVGELAVRAAVDSPGIASAPLPASEAPLYRSAATRGSLPDVFYVMLDGYSRRDELAKLGGDDARLYRGLQALGFYVADRARANYPMTHLALPAVWTMSYPAVGATDDLTPSELTRVQRGRNLVVSEFRALGYEHVRMGPGPGKPTDCSGVEDLCLAHLSGHHGGSPRVHRLDYLEQNLLKLTPLFNFLSKRFPRDVYSKNTLDHVLNALKRLPTGDRPRYVEVNVWQPHGPYLYRGDCSRRDDVIPYGETKRRAERIEHYVAASRCAATQLLRLLAFLAEEAPDSIVVIHSDHGHAFDTDWRVPNETWAPEAIASRTSVLWAAKLPDRCRDTLYATISPVNTFRLVFACLYETEPKLLPDRSYLTSYYEPGLDHYHELPRLAAPDSRAGPSTRTAQSISEETPQ